MTRRRALDAIFPWGSDSESTGEDVEQPLEPVAQTLTKQLSRPKLAVGITFNLVPHGCQAGQVLLRCQNAIQKLRVENGGESLAIYKIGITHDYSDRFELYEANGWTTMLIMIESSDLGFVEMLEAALISHHRGSSRLAEFWERFRGEEPTHEVFDHGHFIDYSSLEFTAEPRWLSTCGANNALPWTNTPPWFDHLPAQLYEDRGRFFKLDLLHIFHLGVGRDFAGSSLSVLLEQIYQGDTFPEKLQAMNDGLRAFCASTGKQIHFKLLTRELLGFTGYSKYPTGHWNKASDTPVLVEFVFWILQQHAAELAQSRMLQVMSSASEAVGIFMRELLRAPLWLSPQQAQRAGDASLHFLQCYAKLVKIFYQKNECKYNLDEDFIGRVSRLSSTNSQIRSDLVEVGFFASELLAQSAEDDAVEANRSG
ncbi:unnamed protein product [Symbiodinium necroappetens]|uniref:Uncharacterized protein n=1 Tax=Symbiodinium necroappetens TaxID=1628268 RepID=A0A812N5S5_9DINO|nr:unnamed protein product [Symbiodinium necroappetens]